MVKPAYDSKSQMEQVFKDPKYRGKHVAISGGKIYTSSTGSRMAKILDRLYKKHPRHVPHISYVPKPRIVIL